jgi:hypothetical protein
MVAEIVGGLMLGSWHWSPTGCTCRPDAPDVVGAVRFDPLGDRPHQFAGPGHHAAVIRSSRTGPQNSVRIYW